MPRERPTPPPFEPGWLDRSLDRYLIAGLVFMAILIAGFVTYAVREPGLRDTAKAEQTTTYVALGRDLFASNCASCHGEGGAGGGDAPTLDAKQFLDNTSDEQITTLVAAGIAGSEMPAWSLDFGGTLTQEQVKQLTVYLRSLQPDAPSVPDWRESAPADTADHSG